MFSLSESFGDVFYFSFLFFSVKWVLVTEFRFVLVGDVLLAFEIHLT